MSGAPLRVGDRVTYAQNPGTVGEIVAVDESWGMAQVYFGTHLVAGDTPQRIVRPLHLEDLALIEA
jgi:hypothetical protein